jgi:hypothetical protein
MDAAIWSAASPAERNKNVAQYLVRIEAVNLANFIEDTQDLSTIRGGGLLLLNAPEDVPPELKLTKIYVGASTGLFQAEIADGTDLEAWCERVRAAIALGAEGARASATLVVDCAPVTGDFVRDQALAAAGNRWRQMQTPSVILPVPGADPCQVDRVRPSQEEELLWKGAAFAERPEDRRKQVSQAVKERREYGVDQKRCFYRTRVPNLRRDQEFTNDLEQISDYRAKGNLHRKIALIYLDGNGFGTILRSCRKACLMSNWSDLLKLNQDQFLSWLLSIPGQSGVSDWTWSGDVISNTGAMHHKESALRIETLLWGGDEIIWAVPAWTGWWVLQKFFELYGRLGSGARREFDPGDGHGARPLTHSAAVIFSHHNAPIHRIVKLAHRLTDKPKDLIRESKQPHDYCAYQALESFDHLGEDPEGARDKLVAPLGVKGEALLLRGEQMGEVQAAIATLKAGVARSRMHDVLAAIYREGKLTDGIKDGKKALDRAERDLKGTEAAFEQLRGLSANCIPGVGEPVRSAIAWLHAAELWDYALPAAWQTPPMPVAGGAAA